MTEPTKIIYIMGAGRSGTTALGVFLNAGQNAQFLGELNQLPQHIVNDTPCSCGNTVSKCDFWSGVSVINRVDKELQQNAEKIESHSAILKYMLNSKLPEQQEGYAVFNSQMFSETSMVCENEILIDSSKYMARCIALSRLKTLDVKVLYLVRDPRAVVHSFGKNVQTRRGLLSAVFYYNVVNVTAELVSRILLKNKVLKLYYENMVEDPQQFFQKIADFSGIELTDLNHKIAQKESFKVQHVIGGNRITKEHEINFNNDSSWKTQLPRLQQWLIYCLTLPLNLINRYKI